MISLVIPIRLSLEKSSRSEIIDFQRISQKFKSLNFSYGQFQIGEKYFQRIFNLSAPVGPDDFQIAILELIAESDTKIPQDYLRNFN